MNPIRLAVVGAGSQCTQSLMPGIPYTYVWEPHHTLPTWQRSGYGNQLQHFARCIQTGESPAPSLNDGYRNLVVAQSILDACASGQVVDVPQD
ncbi:MAG: hypothetical protein O2923_05480 [Verrucomicrobia bacterium]|nr:hypothetical protein [Verrucomicrobiota bacterium]MDA1088487.1 hypothetical protein [Verrucomicrobiota bacterium]